MPNADDILARKQLMEGLQSNWITLWDDVLDHVDPMATPLRQRGRPGEQRAERRFDSTATIFSQRLGSTIVSLIANPAETWIGMVGERFEGGRWTEVEAKDLVEWLESTVVMQLDAYQDSNFYSELASNLHTDITIGSSVMSWDERTIQSPGFNGFSFRNLAPGEFLIDENDQNEVDTFYRKIQWTARQAKQRFPKAQLSQAIEDAIKNKQSDSMFEFVHAVYRRNDPAFGEKRNPADRSINGSEWASSYVDVADKTVVDSGGFQDQRYFASRWRQSLGEMYGRSPSMDALADIKTLNTMVRYGLEAAIIDIYPPRLFPDEALMGRLRLTPGAYNVYDPDVTGDVISLGGEGNFRAEMQREENLRKAIAQAYMDDIFGLREDKGDVTATEILDRRERRTQIAGAPVNRYQTELLGPMFESNWMFMFRTGLFGRPPESISNVQRIRPKFLSIMSRQQKMAAVRSMQDAFAIVGPLAEIRPDMLDNYDFDAIARDVPEDMGLPQSFLLEEEQVLAIRQARAKQQQAQAALEQGQDLAKTAAEIGETG